MSCNKNLNNTNRQIYIRKKRTYKHQTHVILEEKYDNISKNYACGH